MLILVVVKTCTMCKHRPGPVHYRIPVALEVLHIQVLLKTAGTHEPFGTLRVEYLANCVILAGPVELYFAVAVS